MNATNEKNYTLVLISILIGLSVPLGWIFIKFLTEPDFSYVKEVSHNPVITLYLTILPPLISGYWGYRLSQQIALYKKLSSYDPLTNLLNRAAIFKSLSNYFELSKRHSFAVSSLMIDIDHFKKINDEYGHSFGDHVLKTISQTIKQNLRKTDLVGRYGGEEFLSVLPYTDLQSTVVVAERLRRTVESLPVEKDNKRLNVTISLGASSVDEKTENFESLIKRADENLYRAKKAGRNKVVAL